MNGANHKLSGISTYPFQIFGNGWKKIGNDVWIGYDALVMPGVKVGNAAIISSRSVVASDVPAYAIVGGNPARLIRQRFDAATVARLEQLAWWDWPVERITRHLELIVAADVDALAAVAPGA